MGIYKQPSGTKGSLRNIQILINDFPNVINKEINTKLSSNESILWLSPLRNENYAEYRDADFLRLLNLDHLIPELKQFWPNNGPQWDGLGKSSNKVFLVEAKANLPELVSPPCGAKSKDSIERIRSSLLKTKNYLSSNPIEADWSSSYYQYTNRLAHLYFLRSNGINAYLIFLYFVGDHSVGGPNIIEKWMSATEKMKECLKLPRKHRLSEYIIDIYIHVDVLT